MLLRKSFVLIILFLYSNLVSSQTSENDRFHLKKIREFTATNSDSLIYYSKKLKNSKNLCNFYKAVNIEAKALYQKSLLKLAKEKTLFVLENIKNRDEFCFKENKITALNRLFWIYKNQNQFQKAFDVLLKREKIVKSLLKKNYYYKTNLFSTEYNLAIIKSILGLHKEARKILKDMLPKHSQVYKGLNKYYLNLNLSSTLNTIGESYLKSSKHATSSDLDSASVYFKRAFEVVKQFNPLHKNSETLYQLREAEVLISKKKFKDALNIIQTYNVNSLLYKTTQSINSLKAICFYQLKNNDSAIYYSKKFLKNYTKKPKIKKRAIAIYDILANQYYKNKQIDSAYKYSELTLVEIKALSKSKNEINKSHYLYDFKNAEVLNKLILNKNKSNKKEFFIYLFMLLVIASFLIFFYYRKNKRSIIKFARARKQLNDIPTVQKKEYNIDKELERKILKGISDLEKSVDYLDINFNINILAKKLNTNTSYLSYIINKIKGQTFKQYFTALRINFLMRKLEEDKNYSKYTIKFLAEKIGYTNASAFTRAFKKQQGITPSEYIKSLKHD